MVLDARRPARLVDPVRALPGHVRRAGRRTAGEPAAQAGGADVRRRGLPADRLADRLPDAHHQGPGRRGRGGARAGRRRRRGHGGGGAGGGAGQAGVRDQPRRRQARADRRARRHRAGARRPAARAGRRGDRDGRRGDVRPLDEVRRRSAPASWSPARPPGTSRRSTCAGCSRCSWRSSARRWARRTSWARCWPCAPSADIRPVIDSAFGFAAVATRSPSSTPATSSARWCIDHTALS